MITKCTEFAPNEAPTPYLQLMLTVVVSKPDIFFKKIFCKLCTKFQESMTCFIFSLIFTSVLVRTGVQGEPRTTPINSPNQGRDNKTTTRGTKRKRIYQTHHTPG